MKGHPAGRAAASTPPPAFAERPRSTRGLSKPRARSGSHSQSSPHLLGEAQGSARDSAPAHPRPSRLHSDPGLVSQTPGAFRSVSRGRSVATFPATVTATADDDQARELAAQRTSQGVADISQSPSQSNNDVFSAGQSPSVTTQQAVELAAPIVSVAPTATASVVPPAVLMRIPTLPASLASLVQTSTFAPTAAPAAPPMLSGQDFSASVSWSLAVPPTNNRASTLFAADPLQSKV